MEAIKTEVVTLQKAGADVVESHVQELNETQLALVGGGIGSVIFD